MKDATFTFRLEEDLKLRFTTLARTLDRSSADLLRDYILEFVERQEKTYVSSRARHDA
ncbi:CopG family ribbon-helix-helix protein [Pararhodospirillum photometricum]|uniref:Putative yacA [Plasmid ColIb-P9] n=1 Tax=Pararhodospirillum photometricum DSM 122 TaxID=1150469 RepID=H6SIX3_PARPM|nr:ribbon-helix-helix protein, CopG family [Pararhodospirillum photometricum]CCG07938.1 Putative yacA [Plasmid ColIb-P9] [Pararhodospirillum photometricum DSM 122]